MPKIGESTLENGQAETSAEQATAIKETPKVTRAKKPRTAVKAKAADRPVIYPDLEMRVSKVTAEEARQLLGWTVVDDKWKGDYYIHLDGTKYVLANNASNRVLDDSRADWVCQEILRGRWKLNGETIVVGKHGSTLSAQHRLVGLIRAVARWTEDPSAYPYWAEEPTLHTALVLGVEEDDETVNTLDTGRPRTLTDVLYRMDTFAKLPRKERQTAAKALDYAIRFVWHRTGVDDAYSVLRTHAESVDWMLHHAKLSKMVRHVIEEEGGADKKLSRFLPLGTLAGLAYVAASSGGTGEKYLAANPRTESKADWSAWDKAEAFITELAGDALPAVANAIADSSEEGRVTVAERVAILAKAWTRYAAGQKLRKDLLALDFSYTDDNRKILNEFPLLGGIDAGDPADRDEDVTTEEEVEAAKAQVRQENGTGDSNGEIRVGRKVWVAPDEGDPWYGTLTALTDGTATVKVAKGFAGAGKEYSVPEEQLRDRQPEPVSTEGDEE